MGTTTNGATRQAAIREAALTLFAERGYHGTSMKDIAQVVGIRAPSLYNYVEAKQEILRDVMLETMHVLLRDHSEAVARTSDIAEQLRRAMEAHVRYHARYRRQIRIGNTEIASLEPEARSVVRKMRHQYALQWQELIERGLAQGAFSTLSPQLAAYALLEMGIGVALWFREDGPLSESQVVFYYGDMALRLVGASACLPPPLTPPPSPGLV